MNLTVDTIQPVEALIRAKRISLDPRYPELRRYHETGNVRASYFRSRAKGGLTVDEFGELLLDRGYVTERPSEREVLDLLDRIFTAPRGARPTGNASADAVARANDDELRKARTNRNRLYMCQCQKSHFRSARLDLLLTCGYCSGRVVRTERTVSEILHDVPLSTIQSAAYLIGDAVGFETVPF